MKPWPQHAADIVQWIDAAAADLVGITRPSAATLIAESAWNPTDDRACPRCAGSAGVGEVTPSGCASCRDRRLATSGIVRLGQYNEPLRPWILMIKFHGWSTMAHQLGGLLAQQIIAQRGPLPWTDRARTVVVPMPMPVLRRWDRGSNHAEAIAAGVARALGIRVVRGLRRRSGPTQVGLPRSRRRTMGGKGVSLRRQAGRRLRDHHVILIDDVLTTGATMHRAARVLRRAGAKSVLGGILGVTREPGRRDDDEVARTTDGP